MALVKCKECGHEVSQEAKACPSCGAKPPKQNSVLGILFVGLVGYGLFQCSSTINETTKRQEAIEAAKTPAQKEADAMAKKADETRLEAAFEMVQLVKKHAKDPDSVKFSQIAVSQDGKLVCATYRARNSFNAIVPGATVIYDRNATDELAVWKKKCAKAPGLVDYTYAGGT